MFNLFELGIYSDITTSTQNPYILSHFKATGDRLLSFASLFRFPIDSTHLTSTPWVMPDEQHHPADWSSEQYFSDYRQSASETANMTSYYQAYNHGLLTLQFESQHPLDEQTSLHFGHREEFTSTASYGLPQYSFRNQQHQDLTHSPTAQFSYGDRAYAGAYESVVHEAPLTRVISESLVMNDPRTQHSQFRQPYSYHPGLRSENASDELSEGASPEQLVGSESSFQEPSTSNPLKVPNNFGLMSYPDMTTMVNSEANIPLPMVETTFVDPSKCLVCGKKILRDMTRHMWTHQKEKRFKCVFPRSSCQHRSGLFNRRYDFKKHLLNNHFIYDDISARKEHNLREKLTQWGTCQCGQRFLSGDWLSEHILTKDENKKCPALRNHEQLHEYNI